MKKFLIVISFLAMAGVIVGLSFYCSDLKQENKSKQQTIESLTFVEGNISESEGLVTVSRDQWVVFEEDPIVNSDATYSFVGVKFLEFYQNGQVDSFSKNLLKLKYSKKVTIQAVGNSRKETTYFLVGSYYVASASTLKK